MANEKILQVVDLCKSFHKLDVLKHISVDFEKNEVVSIIGPSGGGKSTFLRCLNLLETPTSGQILFDGVDICAKGQSKHIDQHRQKMGMVFQQFNLFNNMNVMHNLTAAPTRIKGMDKEQAEAKALQLLGRVGLADRADAYPSQLSGGQKRRGARRDEGPRRERHDDDRRDTRNALRTRGQQPHHLPRRRSHRGG